MAASREADLAALLKRVTAPRSPFAGIALDRPVLMGIVNVTPDSFSDGGLYDSKEEAIAHAAELVEAGAAIVDIGGEFDAARVRPYRGGAGGHARAAGGHGAQGDQRRDLDRYAEGKRRPRGGKSGRQDLQRRLGANL